MTIDDRAQGFSTRALHGGRGGRVTQRPLSPPLYQAATFAFDDMAEFAAVAESKISGGYLYSRWANPTVDALGAAVASLEGAQAAACFASGMGAIATTLLSLVRSGDHVVSTAQLYGGTHSLLERVLDRCGVSATRVDARDLDGIEGAFRPETRVLYAETIGNPTLVVADLDRLSRIARSRGATFVVDATFTPPSILRALEHGADLVAHSATKLLAGHSDVTAGVVVGGAEAIAAIPHLSIDLGAICAPFEAWLCLRGLETLELRTARVCSNALTIARALEKHPSVERVLYPGLESHPDHELARATFGDRFGGMLAVEVGGGIEAGRRAMERVRVFSPAASLGGTKSLIVHPASVTHTQLSPEQRRAVGLTDGMLRLSIGIEDADDLVADLEEALR